MSNEVWFARFDGGPLEGTRAVDSAKVPFPGPEVIEEVGGRYARVRFSQLEADVHPNVARGAEYQWEPAEAKVKS